MAKKKIIYEETFFAVILVKSRNNYFLSTFRFYFFS